MMNINVKFLFTMYLALITRANEALKLNEITVPNYHILQDDNKLLLLRCDYSIDDDETGFVLKWYFNAIPIYQWIPPRVPHVFSNFKGRVDTSYFSSNDLHKRHSSLAITNLSAYDTGNYSCVVQTFQSFDEKTKPLIIIDPGLSIDLTMKINEIDQVVDVVCSVLNIYKIKMIRITINGKDSLIKTDKYEHEKINKYTAKMNIEGLSDQSTFTCLASFNEIDYEMRKEIIYRAPKTTFSPEKVVRFFSSLLHSYDRFIRFYFN